LQDVQRAIGYVRANAENLNIDPKRIGVMGFSAGGHLAAMVSNNFLKRTYPAIDATDKVSCRPDYCLLVYPAYLDGENFQLAPELKVSSATPPTMLIQAEDDKSYINSSIFYYYALKEAGVPAWMHLYSQGGHGYGLRDTGASVNEWPDRAEDWFREIGLIE
jgi:acetyl esterase/lipase